METILTDADDNTINIGEEHDIRKSGKILRRIGINTYMDKNQGAGILMCKKQHWLNHKNSSTMIQTTTKWKKTNTHRLFQNSIFF